METPLPCKALRKFMRLRVCFSPEILGERFRFCPVPGAKNCVNLHSLLILSIIVVVRWHHSWAKILLFLSNKTFQVLIFENVHIIKSCIIKFLVNIWNHGKNLQDLSSQKPLLKRWTAVTFGHLSWFFIYHDFHALKVPYLFFISKIIIQEIRLYKEKHMLTDYFRCYKLNKTSTPLPRREKFSQT